MRLVYYFTIFAISKFFNGIYGQTNMFACPQGINEQPFIIQAIDTPIYIVSQNQSSSTYSPNMDCRIILMARNNQKRVQLTIMESVLEEPIFTDCNDYVSIHDGNQSTAKESIRWCGTEKPISITSSTESLYMDFHSDGLVQKRGFNMSFIDFNMPGCPPDWVILQENEFCYKLFDEQQGTTWIDSQKACTLERSNLLTFDNPTEYAAVVLNFSQSHSFPWIGYYDANNEGTFESVDKTSIWPGQFPSFTTDHTTKDCMYFDWNIKEGDAYAVNDCRTKHSFICKKRIDGSTIPYPPPIDEVRRGLGTASVDYTFWIMILLALLLLLLILLIICYRCKKRHANRIINVDQNHRMVEASQSIQSHKNMQNSHTTLKSTSDQGAKKQHIDETSDNMYKQKTIEVSGNNNHTTKNFSSSRNLRVVQHATVENNTNKAKSVSDSDENNSPRFEMTPNQPLFTRVTTTTTPPQSAQQQSSNGGATNVAYEHDREETTMQAEHSFSQNPGGNSLGQPVLNLQNEASVSSGSSRPSHYNVLDSSTGAVSNAIGRSRRDGSRSSRIKSFERPHVGTLDHVSAISLDEFWKQV